MNRSIKSFLIIIFAAVCALSASFFVINVFGGNRVGAEGPTTFETYGTSVRLVEPSGLRFSTKVSESYIMELDGAYGAGNYKFGTLIIPTALLNGEVLTADNSDAIDLERTVWSVDGSDGYKIFNAVLTGIPSSFYGTDITARAYVKPATGNYIYSDPLENSIAKVASYALNDGLSGELLTEYVGGGIETVIVSESKTLYVGESGEISLITSPSGYKAVWKSSDETVVTVDKDGVVKGIATGVATVTATIGGISDECEITVKKITVKFDNSSKTDITAWADESVGVKETEYDYGDAIVIPTIKYDTLSAAAKADSTYSMAAGVGYWYYKNSAGVKIRFDPSKALTWENYSDVDSLEITLYVQPIRQWAGPY